MKRARKIFVWIVFILFVAMALQPAMAENYTAAEFNAALRLNKSNVKKVKKGQYVAFKQDQKVVLIGRGHDSATVEKVKKKKSGGLIWRVSKKKYEIECKKGHCDRSEFESVMNYCGVKRKNLKWR